MNQSASGEAAARAAVAFAEPIEGPSHRPGTRLIAVTVVLIIAAWGVRLLWQGGTPSPAAMGAAAAVLLLLVWPLPGMVAGRTRIDAHGISQQGWSAREVAWTEIQRLRFTRLALTPRLVVSTGIGRFKVFYSGSPELDTAFERAVDILTGPVQR